MGMMTAIERGVLYIVTGEKYVRAAINSANSVREHSPSLKIHFFVDRSGVPLLERADSSFSIGLIEEPHYRSKVDYLHQSPFDRTLYLDSDTSACYPLDEIFGVLERFDIAATHAHRRNHPNTLQPWRIGLPASFPQLNCGVIAYRSNREVIEFLKNWRDAFHLAKLGKDQVTFRELLWLSDLRLYVLPPEYNVRYDKYVKAWDEVEAIPKILHYRKFHDDLD